MKMPFADVSSLRGTTSGIIAASAGEKNTLTIEIAVFSRMISQKLSPTAHSPMNRMPRIRLVPMRINRRSIRSTYTPATADSSTAGTRNVRIRSALALFEPVASRTIRIRANNTMLPPIWVTSCASQSRRKFRLLEDLDRARLLGDRFLGGGHGASPGPVVPILVRRCDRGGQRGITSLDELHEPALERPPLQQDVTTAPSTAKADVRAQAVDGPGVVAAGVGSLEPDDVTQEQLEDGLVRHSGRQRIKRDGVRVVGRRVPGRAPARWRAARGASPA